MIAYVLQNWVAPPDWWQYVLAIVLNIPLIFLEAKGYLRFWPPPSIEE